ncbi:MAG: hypothetical protein QXJ93_02880 [Candidatus Rehaiarchaeum fermentans]|nr:hypothetical protein [Candidatus Rehaiarchaeum fermentans]
MAQLRKFFYVDEETIELFNKLKQKYTIEGDSALFKTIVKEIYEIENRIEQALGEKKEELEDLKKENKSLYLKIGELQGELNIYKQQALPRKSFWRRLFSA